MSLKAYEGTTSRFYAETIDDRRVAAFSQAISGSQTDTVPPTYLTRLRHGEFELLQKMGVELNQVLHGEQEYRYDRELRAGLELRYQTKLAQVLEKKGSSTSLHFLVFETEFLTDQVVAASKTTMIIRQGG